MPTADDYAPNPALNEFLGIQKSFGIPSPMELGKAAEASERQKAGAGAAEAKQIRSGMKQRDMLTSSMDSSPKAPELNKNLPDAPQEKYQDPTQAFTTFAPVLAVFGSLLTRTPMTTAMNAAAAAMKGFHEGDKDAYERQRQIWVDNTEKALDQNKLELEQYKAAQEEHKGNMTDMQAKMEAIAANNSDWHTLAALKTPGGASAVFERLKMMQEAGDKMQTQFTNYMKAKTTAAKGAVSLTDGAIDTYAEAIANGVKPSSLGLGYGNSANKTAVLNRTAELYPNLDLADAEADFGGLSQEKRTEGASFGRVKLAANSLDRAIPLARDAAKGVDLGRFPSINAVENAVSKGTGDPRIIALNTALQTVVSDYAALMVRSGVPTVESRNAAREMVNQNMASGQLDAFFDQIEKEKTAQLKALDDTKGKSANGAKVVHWDDLE